MKPERLKDAKLIFNDLKINITTEGKKHLGAVIGSVQYREEYVKEKVENWVSEIETLAKIAVSQPQAAYSAFISGYMHKFTYLIRTMGNISHMLQPVEDAIRYKFIYALCEGRHCNDIERSLLAQ